MVPETRFDDVLEAGHPERGVVDVDSDQIGLYVVLTNGLQPQLKRKVPAPREIERDQESERSSILPTSPLRPCDEASTQEEVRRGAPDPDGRDEGARIRKPDESPPRDCGEVAPAKQRGRQKGQAWEPWWTGDGSKCRKVVKRAAVALEAAEGDKPRPQAEYKRARSAPGAPCENSPERTSTGTTTT